MSTYYNANVNASALTFGVPAAFFTGVALLFTFVPFLATLKYASAVRWATGLFGYILVILLVIVMSAWNALPFPLGVVIVCLFVVVGVLHLFRRDLKSYALMSDDAKPANHKDYFHSVFNGVKYRKIAVAATIAICLGIAFLLLFSSRDLCFCSHPYTITTRMSRTMGKPSCEKGKMCYIYLNIAEDPSTTIIINYHTRDSPVNSYVKYDTESHSSYQDYKYKSTSIVISMDDIFDEESRFVSSTALTALTPNTTYYFVTCVETSKGVIITSEERKFKTFHTTGDTIKFVNGGDWQMNEEGEKLANLAREQNPDFISIGGDIAYADGMNTCWKRWDERLAALTTMTQLPNGYTAPLLMAIGNHEGGGFYTPMSMAAFYMRYFTFSVTEVDIEPNTRSTYHMHKLGNHTALSVLDSDVITRWDAGQAAWLDDQFNHINYVDVNHRVAIYHCPMYPSASSYDDPISVNGRKHILPVFDKYHVDVGLEQHDHVYKRSKILYNSKVVDTPSEGTIYLGDGSWGLVGATATTMPWYLENHKSTSHVWIVELNSTTIQTSAMNPNGEIFDYYVINK